MKSMFALFPQMQSALSFTRRKNRVRWRNALQNRPCDFRRLIARVAVVKSSLQYIGDGGAVYPAIGLPLLDEESVLAIFDVPEKQREDWYVRSTCIPEGINLDDIDGTEKPVEREAISISTKARVQTMPKMTIRVILKSGAEFAVKCDKFTVTRDGFGNVAGYNISGIAENKPVYIDFTQVAAVVRVYSDEREVADDEQCASIL